MQCPDARDADLYQLVQQGLSRGAPPSGGGVPIVVGMSLEEYRLECGKVQRNLRRKALAELEVLFPPEQVVSEELVEARRQRDAWAAHAAGSRPTRYAIEQAGHWQRRVNELELGTIEPMPAEGKIVPMPKVKRRRASRPTKRRTAA